MNSTEEKITVKMLCPYCKLSFDKNIERRKTNGLYNILIKTHPKGEECLPFIAFIDNNGKHRGSQKIDNIEN